MIRTIVGLAFAGIALTPFAEKAELHASAAQGGVNVIEAALTMGAGHRIYEAASPSGILCRIMVDGPGGAMAEAHADKACGHVYAGLETVSGWSPAPGGNVRLVDAAGRTVVEIGASDGFAYEAVSPAAAQIMISEIQG